MAESQYFLGLAKRASLSAGNLLLRKFGDPGKVKNKSARDLVTDADYQSEKLIISMIRKEFPDHSILAEESGEAGPGGEFTWVIDPLDGTNNFAFGIPLFGVSIALLKGGEPLLGVINLPVWELLLTATKEKGAYMNGRKLRVSRQKELKETIVFYHLDPERRADQVPMLTKVMESAFSVRMLGAAVIHLSMIARGDRFAWVETGARPWDISAGAFIVEMAGGKATDFEGKPWDPWSRNLVVSNGKVHGKILEILKGQ